MNRIQRVNRVEQSAALCDVPSVISCSLATRMEAGSAT